MSSSPSDAEKRQLVKPSKFQPWGVQVVSLVPESVNEILPLVVGGAVARGWAAVALKEGKIHAFPVKTSTLSQQLQVATLGHKLYHPSLASASPLLALSSMDQGAHVHVYAAHPKDGSVFLWRLGHEERTLVLPRSPQSRALLPLQEKEEVSCLSCDPLVVGTSWGRLFWCTETAQPLMLHAQPMERPSTSMLSRFLSSSTIAREEPVHDVLKLSKDTILSVSQAGKLLHWKVTTTVAASHRATFEVTPIATLEEAAADHLHGARDISVIRCNCLQHEDGETFGLNFIVQLTLEGEARLYWLQGTISNNTEFEVGHAIYLNRFHALEIDCVGLVTTREHLSYAAFQYDESLPVTVMALMDDSSAVHEVDLPMKAAPQLVKGTMGRDTVTHGWCALSVTGLGLRGRWTGLQMEAVSATPMKRARGSSPSDVATLTSHLRSAFWYWYQNSASSVAMRLPPSLQEACREDLEPAILATAKQLQHEGDSSSLHNPLEWHTSFIDHLQHGGLYRSLSSVGRYALMGIGQELVVYRALAAQTQDMDESCQPHGIVDWLYTIQERALGGGREEYVIRWEELLALALQAATQYRREQAGVRYDIASNSSSASTPPTRLWTHHPTLQTIMIRQVQVWQNYYSSQSVNPDRLTAVVRAALLSFSETRTDSAVGETRYHDVKTMGIPLVQRHVDGDAVAFELSVQHEYYEGICQICYEHESDDDQSFRMEPLLAEDSPLHGGHDEKTGFDFVRFVLEWHADRGLYAHVLNYGRFCPQNVLSRFLEENSRMRPYQWVPAIRNQQFDAASHHLLEDAMRPNATLSSCHWSLSMAKLSNFVSQEEKSADDGAVLQELKRQRTLIDNKMELVQAQKLLVEKSSDDVDKQQPFLSPEDLLSLTLNKLQHLQQEMGNIEDDWRSNEAVQLCLIGLAVCRSMEGNEKRTRLASRVWAQSLLVDMLSWKNLIENQQHVTKQQLQKCVLESTIFGQVLQQYEANITNNHAKTDFVAYDTSMENLVLEQLGLDQVDVFEIKRLLRIGTHLVLPAERPMAIH